MNKFVNNIFVLFCWFCFCFVIVLMTRMQPGLSPEFWILFQTIFQTEYILIMNTFHWRLLFFLSWSVYYGYHIVQVPGVVMECCSGFNGTDCTTRKKWLLHNYKYFFPCILKNLITDSTTLCIKAICTTPCEPGYSCTSPDECTPNTTFIGRLTQQFSPFVVFSYLFINILNFFQTLRTPQLVPVLWSMKLLQLLLSQVKLSTKAGGLYSLKWWLRAFHIFIEEHQCKVVYVTCSLCFYTLQMNKCRRIQNIFEF